jgi:gliding motility-associated-like protein
VVSTGDSIFTYINGIKRYSCSYNGGIGSHNLDLFIGKLDNSTYPYWLNADVDDIRIYNRSLAPSEVKGYCGTCNISVSSDCDTTNLNSGKVLHLDFNGNTQDKSGLGNHATNFGATLTSDRKGNANAAYSFNGSTSRMVIPNFPTSSSNNISISVWFKSGASSQQAYAGLLDHSHTTGTLKNWTIQHSNTNSAIFFDWRNSASNWANTINDPVSYDHAKWNHLVVVKKSDTLQYYLNCILVFEKKYTGMDNIHKFVADLNIGFIQSNSGPIRYYNGSMDELRVYHRVLTQNEIKALGDCCSTLTPLPCDTSGLVLCMSMDGNANDSTKYAHHGIVRGATPTSNRFGNTNSAYSFNGISNYINLGNKSLLKPNKATISMWVKPNDISTSGFGHSFNPIMVTGNTNSPGHFYEAYFLGISTSGNNKFHVSSWNPSPTISGGGPSVQNFNLNTWHHLTTTIDNDSIKIYINGVLDKAYFKGFATNYSNIDSIIIANSGNSAFSQRWFNGALDDIKMYNRVLSATEVQDLYSKPFTCNCNSIQPPPCDTSRRLTYTQCLNDSIQVVLRPGSQYQWSPSIGLSSDTVRNPKIYLSANRTYLVSYQGLRGCQLIDTIDILVKPAAIYPKIEDQLICIGDSIQIDIPIYATNILWSPNLAISSTTAKNPYFFPTTNRTYYLEFRDSFGCIQKDTFDINTKVCCPARARFTIPKDMLCYGENLAITNRSKGPITSYNWSFGNAVPSSHAGSTPPVLNFPNGGTYPIRLIVTNGSCQDTMEKMITVVQIMPNAGRDTTNCLGAFVTVLGESPISDWSYKWTPTKYLSDPTISDPICSIVNDSVNYILEITDRSSGCKAYDTVVVYTNRNIVSKTTKQRICSGDSVLFNNNYSKTTNLYYYTIKKTDGICDSFIDILDLNVLQKQVLTYTPKIHCEFYIDGKGKRHDTSYIEQDTIRSKSLLNCDSIINITPREIFKKTYTEKTVQGCSPFLYNGKTYITSKVKEDSIRIRGAYSGCDSIIEYINVIVYPKPKAEISPSIPNPVLYKQTVTLTASGGSGYLWLQMGSTNSEIDYKLNQIQPRLFTVRVTDDNNCWDTVSYIVNGELPDTCYYGFPNAFTPNQDGLNDEYIPNMDECTEIKVFAIYDRWGEKVFETNQQKGWNGFYKGKPAPLSVYLYYAELITPWGIKIHKGNFTLIR